jgi:hypothetical protein
MEKVQKKMMFLQTHKQKNSVTTFMAKALSIITLFFSLTGLSQNNFTIVFDYDTTKVYLKYSEVSLFMKKENLDLISRAKPVTKNDTLVVYRNWVNGLYMADSLEFDLDPELFKAIRKNKGTIIHKGKTITSCYTKRVKLKKAKNKYFKGIYYYDTVSDKHFLTEVLRDYPFIDHPEINFGNSRDILE